VADLHTPRELDRAGAVGRGIAGAHVGGLDDAVADEVTAGDEIDLRYLKDWVSALSTGAPAALVRPRTVAHISAALRICHDLGVAVVPQGGRTGLVGGATPIVGSVVISMDRFAGIEELDPAGATMTVRAGTPLQTVQEAAAQAGFFFPLDLGARGSCQIGGNVATNAGGNRVIRYGMTRELVLGLEVVLPDGTIVTTTYGHWTQDEMPYIVSVRFKLDELDRHAGK